MNAHRWDIARGPLKCKRGICTTVIGAGEPYRRVSRVDYPYCAPCAKEMLGEDPPPDLPADTYAKRLARVAPPSLTPAADLARAPLETTVAKAKVLPMRDYAQRAANDREPGEEG